MSRKATAVLLLWSVLLPPVAWAQGADFVPGARQLLLDEYRELASGAPTPHWRMRGAAPELVNGRLQLGGGSVTRMTPNIASWPESFTIEMSIQGEVSDDQSMRDVTWMFENGDAWAWRTSLALYANGQCTVVVEIADPGENQNVRCDWLRDTPNQYALWIEKGRVRVYLNGKRLVDMNQVQGLRFGTAALQVSADAIPVSFGAFRIAESTSAVATTLPGGRAAAGVSGAVSPGDAGPLGARSLDPNALRQPALTITTPKSGDVLATGSTYPISWQYQAEAGPLRIELATAAGGAPLWIAPAVALDGSGTGRYDWQVFDNLRPATNYFLRITSESNAAQVATVGPITIALPGLALQSPQPQARFPQGQYVPIRWTYTGNIGEQVRVTATLAGSVSPSLDALNIPVGSNGQGEYSQWMPPSASVNQQFNVRVQSVRNAAYFSEASIAVVAENSSAPLTAGLVEPVYLQRAVATFETQDEDKDRLTSVTVRVLARGQAGGSRAVAELVDAASSRLAMTEYPRNTTASLGLSVHPDTRPADCSDLELWVDVKQSPRLVDALQFDKWRFKPRVDLFFSDGTRVIKTSPAVVERGGFYMPPAQPIIAEVLGPTQIDTPTARNPKAYYDQLVSELRLVIQTGSDDLRGGSEVDATVLVRDGPGVAFPNINKGQRWSDNSTATVSLPFSGEVLLDSITGIELNTDFSGGVASDNWKLNSIEVIGMVKGRAIPLMTRSGNPLLFNFSGSNGEYTVTR